MSYFRQRGVSGEAWGKPDRDAAGRAVCRCCRALVRPPRRTFCSDRCVHEWRIRSDVGYTRDLVWKRDRGVCQRCLLDLVRADREWRRARPATGSRRALREWRDTEPCWEVDHIVPVADGGGECGLSNLRLLCRPCHVAVTQAWKHRRRSGT